MGTREDLLAAAEKAASRAVADDVDWRERYAEIRNAKAALEAAQLANDTPVGDIDQALASIQDLLADAGVLDRALELDPTEFLRQTYQALLAWRGEVLKAQGFEVGYDVLRQVLATLERDFTASPTPTSMRIAARIHTALEEAAGIVQHGQQGVADGNQDDEG